MSINNSYTSSWRQSESGWLDKWGFLAKTLYATATKMMVHWGCFKTRTDGGGAIRHTRIASVWRAHTVRVRTVWVPVGLTGDDRSCQCSVSPAPHLWQIVCTNVRTYQSASVDFSTMNMKIRIWREISTAWCKRRTKRELCYSLCTFSSSPTPTSLMLYASSPFISPF